MKILTITIPSYNSEDYMDHCIKSLLPGGEDVEILVVDDGSSDHTAEIADGYEKKYPGIVRAIHQKNGGHGAAVNTGIAHASGKFFKVVDSDDWVDEESYKRILHFLKLVVEYEQPLDMLLSNFVYEKEGARHKKVMRPSGLPKGKFFSWDDVRYIRRGHYILMHSIIYRTQLLRDCGLELPRHTFYVDNLYAFQPLPFVKTIYYLDLDFYRYYIGREDQSVNEKVMVKRIDQQIRVNKLMADCYAKSRITSQKCRKYMYKYLEIITTISFVLMLLEDSPDYEKRKAGLWRDIREINLPLYRKMRVDPLIRGVSIPGNEGRKFGRAGYRVFRKIFGFN